MLEKLFSNTPVVLQRIYGHAYLVNQNALHKAGINLNTKVEGGQIVKSTKGITGVLVDNPMLLIGAITLSLSLEVKIKALKDAEAICLSNGLTTMDNAWFDSSTIELIDSLQQTGDLSIRIYAIVSNTSDNL